MTLWTVPSSCRAPSFRACRYGCSRRAVLDENPYHEGGANWYIPQNNFFRSVSNLVIDLTQMPPDRGVGMYVCFLTQPSPSKPGYWAVQCAL